SLRIGQLNLTSRLPFGSLRSALTSDSTDQISKNI
ncbi:MAG: hypothetical protein ACI8RA_001628, partial [Chlamydiales bacterium]